MQIELLEIDFNSEEAIYMQLRNQIILGIATSRLQDGDTLPSVRQMAECIGINMHTVNKAYAVLRKEGIVSIDRRKGAVICIDSNKLLALEEMRQNLYIILQGGDVITFPGRKHIGCWMKSMICGSNPPKTR